MDGLQLSLQLKLYVLKSFYLLAFVVFFFNVRALYTMQDREIQNTNLSKSGLKHGKPRYLNVLTDPS